MKSQGHTEGTSVGAFRESGACPLTRELMARVGDKWSMLVVVLLGDGPQRFNELKRIVGGVSQRMLTVTLRGLERDGLVKRTVLPAVPPRVEYSLTPLGRTLLKPLRELATWVGANRAAIEQARAAFDKADATRQSPLGRSA